MLSYIKKMLHTYQWWEKKLSALCFAWRHQVPITSYGFGASNGEWERVRAQIEDSYVLSRE